MNFTIFTGFFLMVVIALFVRVLKILGYFKLETKPFVIVLIIVIWGGLFISSRMIYLKPAKQRSMYRRFRRVPKWLLRTLGIFYCVGCFAVSFAIIIISAKLGY